MAVSNSLIRKKLKILCIHGYRQDGESFRSKLGALRKSTKSFAEYVSVTAPLRIDGNEKERGWWFSRGNNSFDAQEHSDISIGLDDSLKCIADAIRDDGPFDGILGFSQGASFVSLILQLERKGHPEFSGFKFALLYSGFESRNSKHAFGLNGETGENAQIELPALHILGISDKVIPIEQGRDFNKLFKNLKTCEHEGGHFIPSSGESKKIAIEFLQQFLDE